jgi:hypothetical protein
VKCPHEKCRYPVHFVICRLPFFQTFQLHV